MWINISIYAVLTVHVICSILLILIVLMQRPRSEGLGAAFGGGMTESVFGAGTTDVLTKGTIWLGSIFFAATLLLAVLYAHRTPADSAIKHQLMQPDVSATAPALPEAAPAKDSTPATATATPPAPAPAAPASQPAATKPEASKPANVR